MNYPTAYQIGRLLASFAIAALLGLVMVGCTDGDGEGELATPTGGIPDPTPTTVPLIATARALDSSAADGIAVGWDSREEPRVVRVEPLPSGYEVETVVAGLDKPVGLAFLPDGRVLVGEQHAGRIRVIQNDRLREEPFAVIENVMTGTLELGLLGIAVDPEFDSNHWVYAFYVEKDDAGNPGRSVLLRLTERDGVAVERTELAEFPRPAAGKHVGGALKFGPDGKLYLTIGDTDRADQAADPRFPVGKILRLNRDGSAPADNPLIDRPDADPRVFAYGFRNSFSLAFHPELTGRLISADNSESHFDEINIVEPGRFYGWPFIQGFTVRVAGQAKDPAAPVWVYYGGVAPTGMEVYTGDKLAEFQGDLFFCQFRGSALHRMRFSDDFRHVESDSVVVAPGCNSSVAQGPDGFLYFHFRGTSSPDTGILSRIVVR